MGIQTFPAQGQIQLRDSIWAADSDFPLHGQFFARSHNKQGMIRLGGRIYKIDADSIYCQVYFNYRPYKRLSQSLHTYARLQGQRSRKSALGRHNNKKMYVGQDNLIQIDTSTECSRRFEYHCSIEALPGVYSVELGLRFAAGNNIRDTILTRRDSLVCGDVIMISGQSNVVLGNSIVQLDNLGRTFLDTNRSIIPIGYDIEMQNPSWYSTAVAHTKGYTIGGLAMGIQSEILSRVGVPVCIMNGGVNATTIDRHIPTIGPSRNAPSTIYGNLLYRMECSSMQNFPKVLIWYQGESNTLDSSYIHHFQSLYAAWISDYPSLEKVYIVQIHSSNCLPYWHASLKEMQRRLRNLSPKISVVATNAIPFHDNCHFKDSGYAILAKHISSLILHDIYKTGDSLAIAAPFLEKAFWLDSTQKRLCLKFLPESNAPLIITPDTLIEGAQRTIADMFLFDGSNVQVREKIQSLEPLGNDALVIKLHEPLPINTRISYVAEAFYPRTQIVTQGPWIVNKRGIGALSFYDIFIQKSEKEP